MVHLRRKSGVGVVSCDVYIGRPMYQGGWRLPGSRWANPFRGGRDGDRARILALYEAHVRGSPELMAALPELRGKRLGCWCVGPRCLECRGPRGACAHASCHGDVLVKLLGEASGKASSKVSNEPGSPPADLAAQFPDDDPIWAELGF